MISLLPIPRSAELFAVMTVPEVEPIFLLQILRGEELFASRPDREA